ncbi:MAG: cadherin-like domain-containing protein [Nitrospira sp.]|nr:cadherin-like domain-containing protein [Nitrospira sp.]
MVEDILAGVVGSGPAELTNMNGTLFFTALDEVTGNELWASGLAANLLANDTDPDSSTRIVTLGTEPANGTLVLNTDGTFTYRPNTGFTGIDSFTYTASNDDNQMSNVATVMITVT